MKGHKHSLNKYHQWADEVQVGKEAEQREERKWKKIFFIMALCVSLSFCAVFFVTCSLFETATITNLVLSVVMMLVITSNDVGLYFKELGCDTNENAIKNIENGGAKNVE